MSVVGQQTKDEIENCCIRIFLDADGNYVWRDKLPPLPEEPAGGRYYFNFYYFKPYSGSGSTQFTDQSYGPDFMNNPYTLKPNNFTYILPKGITDKNFDKDVIDSFDQIIGTFMFTK